MKKIFTFLVGQRALPIELQPQPEPKPLDADQLTHKVMSTLKVPENERLSFNDTFRHIHACSNLSSRERLKMTA